MIKWFKRIILLVILVFAVITGLVFTSENNTLTPIMLFGYSLPPLQLGLWLVLMLLVGSFIGLCLSLLPRFSDRRLIAAKSRKIEKLEKELNTLRTAALKG